jgi:hypothetical protein
MPRAGPEKAAAAVTARYWFLWVRCPCLPHSQGGHRPSARSTATATMRVTSLIPALSCRSCRPHAPFAELVKLSRTSIADEMREEHKRRVLGDRSRADLCGP